MILIMTDHLCLRVGRHNLVLINSVLTSLVMFKLSFFEVTRGILENIDYYRSRFYWQSDRHKKNIDRRDGISFANLISRAALAFIT
jgi:hypothetical protein